MYSAFTANLNTFAGEVAKFAAQGCGGSNGDDTSLVPVALSYLTRQEFPFDADFGSLDLQEHVAQFRRTFEFRLWHFNALCYRLRKDQGDFQQFHLDQKTVAQLQEDLRDLDLQVSRVERLARVDQLEGIEGNRDRLVALRDNNVYLQELLQEKIQLDQQQQQQQQQEQSMMTMTKMTRNDDHHQLQSNTNNSYRNYKKSHTPMSPPQFSSSTSSSSPTSENKRK